MNNTLKFFAFLLPFVAQCAFADINIAVIDISKIFKESKASSAITNEAKHKQQDLQSAFNNKKSILEEEYKSLDKQSGILSKDSFDKKLSEINAKAVELENDTKSKASTLEIEYMQKLDKISAKLKDLVQSYSDKKKIDLVLQNGQVAYKNKKIADITNDLLELLNKESL